MDKKYSSQLWAHQSAILKEAEINFEFKKHSTTALLLRNSIKIGKVGNSVNACFSKML